MSDGENAFEELMNNHTDCFMCRAISSFALFASGAFLLQQRNNFGRVNMYFQSVFGGALMLTSFVRVMALPPFENKDFVAKRRKPKEKSAIDG